MAGRVASARRYAEAAFELASRDDAHDAWRDDLDIAARLVGDERVADVVGNPAIPIASRRALIESLLGTRVSRPAANLVRLLAERSRIDLLPAVTREYNRLLNRHRGIVEAVVSTAAPLTNVETAAVKARIEEMTGASVDVQTVVDEALIGGLTIRVGDRLLDASVRGRLERLRDQLVAGTR